MCLGPAAFFGAHESFSCLARACCQCFVMDGGGAESSLELLGPVLRRACRWPIARRRPRCGARVKLASRRHLVGGSTDGIGGPLGHAKRKTKKPGSSPFEGARASRHGPPKIHCGPTHHHQNNTTIVIWLILPVVICLSQRLSHACLSISTYTVKLRMAH